MAALLKSAAVASINRGQPSSFYSKDKTNPVFQSLDQEIKKFMGYMRKRNSPGYKKPADEPSSRASDTLFELWNKYEPKLPEIYYQEKLLQMGDFLMTVREYSLALWQCYDRYLLHFGNINVEEITDVDIFRMTFFPEGFDSENAGLTFRALMGKSISMYQTVRMVDPKLQNTQSTDKCVHILSFLRLVMQVVLPKESLCWLVYNGTIHIYSISRHLMSLGHSARVLEFLLWACMCMETSVPLLSVKYLPWRSTLYTAVCQSYFDCKASHHAEAFARRGLAKINELNKLESLSSASESADSAESFRHATVKMAVMVFKRSVYETRRKPKEWLRPKTRANLVEAKNMPWPRTPTERLLADMFEGSASQFLCILESLNDTNRRILLTSPPAADREVEILDVYAELFMSGQEILAGGGGLRGASIKPQSPYHLPALAGVVSDRSLIAMATKGEDGATIDGAIKLVKMAFCFEQWDVFDALIESVLGYLRLIGEEKYSWDEKALELLLAFEKLNPSRRHKRTVTSIVEDDKDTSKDRETKDTSHSFKDHESAFGGTGTGITQQVPSSRSMNVNDEMILAAECLLSVINGPFQPSGIEVDIIVDAALILWNKTKNVFQKHQTGSSDNPKYLTKMENPSKWVFLLDVVHKALCWCGISSVDPALTAEVVLRLALVLESSANIDEGDPGGIKESSFSDTQPTDGSQLLVSRTSMLSMSMINMNPRNQLLQARDILELGLQNVAYARKASAKQDGTSIADVSWAKLDTEMEKCPTMIRDDIEIQSIAGSNASSLDLNEDVFTPDPQTRENTKITDTKEEEAPGPRTREPTTMTEAKDEDAQASKMDLIPESMRGSAMAVWNTIKDLHLELILMYHRVSIKLTSLAPEPAPKSNQPFKRRTCSKMEYGEGGEMMSSYVENYEELLTRCNRNQLSKSLLLMQRSLLLSDGVGYTKEQKKLLEDAVACIQKAQTEEKMIFTVNNAVVTDPKPTKVPTAPILLCRTDTMMIFKPSPFKSEDGQQVSWYKLFARSSSGSNVKVRLNDYFLPGTGESVPSNQSELRVSGLKPDEKYVFAVAAYNGDGQIIGGGIGDSSKPILASSPLPVLMTWAFLSQIAYQVGCYDIAKQACNVLWDHFIAEPPEPQKVTYNTQSEGAFAIDLMKLNQKVVCLTSPVLLRQFLTSIFINVDIAVREGQLFCDVINDRGPLLKGQLRRLKECEKMIVAIEMAGWLNEANLALQGVVQCYGLLAPLIFYKIPSVAVIQVLQRCHAVLQEIPTGLRQKRQQNIADSLHHMTACITYHMAKVLRSWGQKGLANNFNEAGKKLLALEVTEDEKKDRKNKDQKEQPDSPDKDRPIDQSIGDNEAESAPLAKMKKKMKKAPGAGKDDQDSVMNEELKALVAHMYSLSKQTEYETEVVFVEEAHYEHELTGFEDPVVLHAYIAYLPSKLAYREVVKFRKRPKYLEYFVQVAQKALTEGLYTQLVDWCEETTNSLTRRNEHYLGIKQQGQTGSQEDPKRFAVAMAEYSKEKEGAGATAASKQSKMVSQAGTSKAASQMAGSKASQLPKQSPNKAKKRMKYKPMASTARIANDVLRQAQEEAEVKAIDTCSKYFPEIFRMSVKRKKLRRWCMDEMPWRCQMSLIQGLSHFSNFLHKLETRDKMMGAYSSNLYKTNFLDQEWFTFETSGTLIVGWEGGPSRNVELSKKDQKELQRVMKASREDRVYESLDLADERPRTTATGIEIAAALATGAPPPQMYFFPPEQEDTPRTYRSEASNADPPKVQPKNTDTLILSTKVTLESMKKSFAFFNRAIVLAHRGQHWTLLQNSCRALWNCAHTALLRAVSSQPGGEEGLVTIDELRGLVWMPMYMAADSILDMMVQFQNVLEAQAFKAKKKATKLGDYFESWTGDIKNEKGGANLKHENPLDDMSSLDIRWVKRLILRVIELLYYEQKWEKLVDIALRFSALTNDRYGEQIIPILVQAQRQLQRKIKSLKGEGPPQSHYLSLMQKIGGIVTAKDYLHAQLLTHIDKSNLSKISPGAQIDPMGHGVYTSKDGQRVVSVPLDIPHSLQTLRDVLDKSQYTSRALQHSRKLLMLYLAGQQLNSGDGFLSRQVSKVEFQPNTARPQPTMPPDISHDEFEYVDDVQTSCMPRSQLPTVLSSYEKTIDMLNAKKEKGLASQAMHELGNLQYHAGNIRGAYKYWSDSLDLVLNTSDAIHTWRSLLDSSDVSGDMLQRCGLWGCMVGGVLASNIAQYILTSDLGLRMECCFLSGYFFKALFRSSLPHPRADRDYALYDVGEGCEVTNLVPGIDLLSEKFRSDGRQLAAALRWVTEELARGNHNLFVLPLLTLYSYLATFVSRDLQRSVDGRILKVRVLTELCLFNEAFIVMQRLLHGERLPHIGDSNFRQVESKMSSLKYNTSKPITEPNNLKLLEMVLDKRLSSSLATLYGPHMTCHLSLAQANLFIKLAETLHVIPLIEDTLITDSGAKPYTMSTMSKGGLGSRGVKLSTSSAQSRATSKSGKSNDPKKEDEEEADSVQHKHANKRFTASKKPLTQEMIKGTLLAIADQMVGTIAEVIQENAEHDKHGLEGLPAAEMELVVLCKLQQAAIACQKHHSAMAARIVMSALKLLKSSRLFKKRKEVIAQPRIVSASSQERPSSLKSDGTSRRRHMYKDVPVSNPENSLFQYQNFQSRARLDARLWLNCRQALVKCLLIEVRGLGEVKDPETKVLQELADCRQYCIEGLGEAEACGDLEVQADFLYQGALLNIMEGKSQETTISLIEDAIMLLNKVPKLSIPTQQQLVTCMVLKTDLQAAERDNDSVLFTEKTLVQYLSAQQLILKQMETLGEEIQHYYPEGEKSFYSTPISPMKNIYISHMLRLAQVKLRVGHAMARNAAKYIRNGTDKDPVVLWTEVLGVLTTALELSQASVSREANLEAEILFNLGKVERMLVLHGKVQPRKAADTLLQAIKTSFRNDHDLGLMRQAYLEIALVYLFAVGLVILKPNGSLEIIQDGMDETASVRPGTMDSVKSKATSTKSYKSKKDRLSSRAKSGKSEDMDDSEKHRRAAYVAIRCATAVAQAQRSRMLLIGDTVVTSQPLSETAQDEIPDFLSLDLVSVYTLGKKKKKYKNEIEEELAPLIEAQETKKVETYEEQVSRTKDTAKELGWIHILGYQTILQRMCFTATVSASSTKKNKQEDMAEELGDLGPGFDLGFISHAQYDTSLNHDVVRSMLLCGSWIGRLNRLHTYLASNLSVYSATCCGIYPPSMLTLPIPALPKMDLEVICRSYSQNQTNPGDMDPSIPLSITADPGKPLPPPGSNMEPYMPSDRPVTSPTEPQVALQFYQPSLEENDPMNPDAKGPDSRVLLLYALFKKTTQPTVQGLQWISMAQLNDLHDRLAVLGQRGEISLQEKQKKEPVAPSPTPSTKAKKTQRIKALSPKVQRDEQLETLLMQCITDVMSLLGMVSEPEPSNLPIDLPPKTAPEFYPHTPIKSRTRSSLMSKRSRSDITSARMVKQSDITKQIPFEVSKTNIRCLENLFDPSFGALICGGEMVKWLLKIVHTSDTSLSKESTKDTAASSPTKEPTKESLRESIATN
ncbi:cilia- and flagella-associated protein 54-like isoform X1 [Mytilus trossulus]|uniref:cilia- and flagella-associated protein 54-like isoform X1 n=1 Tax=Mytilus trossulus TaxID=6551 RepID=UPI0030048BF9